MFPRQFAQARRKFLVDAAEAAVGEDGDDISAAQFRSDGLDDGVGIGQKARAAAILLDLSGKSRQFEALIFGDGLGAEDSGDDYFIGMRQAAREIALQHAAAQRIGARLENRPQACAGVAGAERLQRSGDGGGMMREVIDDRDAIDLGLHFEAALHALESLERVGDGFFRHAAG